MKTYPITAPLDDPISPSQAVDLIAGVTTSDALNPGAYRFSDGSSTGPAIEKAWQRLFEWLNDERLVGAIELPDGKWRRLSVEWVRSFRRMQRTWRRGDRDEQDCNKPPKTEVVDGKERPIALVEGVEVVTDRLLERVVEAGDVKVEGQTWFLDRGAVLNLMSSRPTHSEIVDWCRAWRRANPGGGVNRAWTAFKTVPRFKSCSRDDVFRPAFEEAANGDAG